MTGPAPVHNQSGLKLWFCTGLALGILVSSLFAWQWIEAGTGTTISVLGSGKYVSVLITHEQRRVLIVSGNNGPAFSNAIGKALPSIADSIDVMIFDPRTSADVTERALALSAKRTMQLPDQDNTNEVGTIQRSFVIDLGDDASVSFLLTPERLWTATVDTQAGRVLIAPDAEGPISAAIGIVLDGSVLDPADGRTAILIGPPASGTATSVPHATVSTGAVLSISVDDARFRLPRGSATNR